MLKYKIIFVLETVAAFMVSCGAIAISYYVSAITVTPFVRLFTEDKTWLWVMVILVGLALSAIVTSWILGKFFKNYLDHVEKSGWEL